MNQDSLPNFNIDQKDDAWDLSINNTKIKQEDNAMEDKEAIENNVINVITNLIKTYPKDPLITSYNAPLPIQTTTPKPIKVTASSIRDKHNNYYTIEISEDQKATDLSIFQFLKNIVKIPKVPK